MCKTGLLFDSSRKSVFMCCSEGLFAYHIIGMSRNIAVDMLSQSLLYEFMGEIIRTNIEILVINENRFWC